MWLGIKVGINQQLLIFIVILKLTRVVNDTLESISVDLGFSGSTMAEGAPTVIILNEILISYIHCTA